MQRFFFDLTTNDHSLYDYRGQAFSSSHSAVQFAQETASMLKHSLSSDWIDWSVEVRDAEGTKLFSLPVGAEPVDANGSTLVELN